MRVWVTGRSPSKPRRASALLLCQRRGIRAFLVARKGEDRGDWQPRAQMYVELTMAGTVTVLATPTLLARRCLPSRTITSPVGTCPHSAHGQMSS